MFKLAKTRNFTVALASAFTVLSACSAPTDNADENGTAIAPAGVVTVYSARHYDSDRLIYEAFEAQTGIDVRVREAGAAQLLETLKAEGDASPADVIIASDAGTLWRFKDAGLTQASHSDTLNAAIPARLRDPEGHWYGLAKRYRIIAYDTQLVAPEEVDEIIDLANPRFEGEICVRSSSNIYNLSLLGELIARNGSQAAESWTQGVVNNFARAPSGGDSDQLRAVAAGACSVAVMNHYYWVRMATSASDNDREAAEATTISFASAGNGVHTNVTAAAVTANAPDHDNAIAFIEFLATVEGQAMLVTETKEFPVVDGAALPAGLENFPDIDESDLDLAALGENQSEAQRIFDRAGWP